MVSGADTSTSKRVEASTPVPPVDPAESQEEEPVDVAKVEAAVLSAVESLLDLADLDVDPTVTVGEGEPEVNVTGPDREWLLDGEGDLLLAVEHLAGRILFRAGCPKDRVRVDCDGFRAGLDEALRERTRKALAESLASGRPVTFEPLGPAERRVIHLAVEEAGGGRSRSEGSGFRRRVRIEAVSSEGDAVELDA
jgi:spoIIIJ-associated protein